MPTRVEVRAGMRPGEERATELLLASLDLAYDGRLADAARHHGVGVVSPGGLPTLS